MDHLLDRLHRMAHTDAPHLGDAELLARFAAQRDELAFAALVRRHGPLVRSVCCRWLPDAADVDDAFQATFLVLAQRAAGVERPDRLAAWLYGVAARTARHLRLRNARRRRYVEPRGELPDPPMWDTVPDPDLGPLLDREVGRLAEKYRLPVILCLMQGLSRQQASRQLQCPEGTLSTRLAHARALLQRRLLARGVAPAAALALLAADAVPAPALVRLTVRAATMFMQTAVPLSPPVAELTRGVLRMLIVKRFSRAAAALAAVLILGAGVTLIAGRAVNAADPPEVLYDRVDRVSTPGTIELVVNPADDQKGVRPIVVREGAEEITVNSAAALTRYFKRARAGDKAFPTSVKVVAAAEAKSDAVGAVIAACRDGGFRSIALEAAPDPVKQGLRRLATNYELEFQRQLLQLDQAKQAERQKRYEEVMRQVEAALKDAEKLKLDSNVEDAKRAEKLLADRTKYLDELYDLTALDKLARDGSRPQESLQGYWKAVEVQAEGHSFKAPHQALDQFTWIIAGDYLITQANGKPRVGRIHATPGKVEFRYEGDGDKLKGMTFKGSFTVTGDTLKLEFAPSTEGTATPDKPGKNAITFQRQAGGIVPKAK
jgi:RNA polymerase sigma factor (sigma-70 family)